MVPVYSIMVLTILAVAPEARAQTVGDAYARELAPAMQRAQAMPRLRSLIVARQGTVIAEKAFRGPGLNTPVNVKSVSKSVISALVGIAVGRGVLTGADQPIANLL
ncbi:unnamed protein product, partial [Laminaria digitata]